MEFNNITFSNLTILPPPPIYIFSSIPSSINEGKSGIFYVQTYNEVPDGTTLYWQVLGYPYYGAAVEDFLSVTGSFTINNTIGSFTVRALADSLTEGSETFKVRLRTGSSSGPIVALSAEVTINDTSTSPPGGSGSYLVVAGGGSGGARYNAGGGGAGGLLYGSDITIGSGKTYTITLGAGGSAPTPPSNATQGANGSNSVLSGAGFTTKTAIGGGGGGSYNINPAGVSGGSGGGASGYGRTDADKGAPTAGQGNYGGRGAKIGTTEGGGYGGAGGGGAGGAGVNGYVTKGGNGGDGIQWIDGNYYAGGGGGAAHAHLGTYTRDKGYGGAGGGGEGERWFPNHPAGDAPTSGTTNTGGGGGGVSGYYTTNGFQAGSGGSGVVIIRYADSLAAATSTTGSPTYTVSGGYRTYKFTASGSITF
jgi:hypothetical protein